jgi:hypothetical protein
LVDLIGVLIDHEAAVGNRDQTAAEAEKAADLWAAVSMLA